MENAQNQDFSLLSQSEIDTLIEFISDKREAVDSSVLNQASIDKLLEMLRFNDGRAKNEEILTIGEVSGALAELVTVRQGEDVCVLECSVDPDNDFVRLEVVNDRTKERMTITPEMFNQGDGELWGHCIAPLVLHRMARALNVKYTSETYETMCDFLRRLPVFCKLGFSEKVLLIFCGLNWMVLSRRRVISRVPAHFLCYLRTPSFWHGRTKRRRCVRFRGWSGISSLRLRSCQSSQARLQSPIWSVPRGAEDGHRPLS